jgi:hypothetical protein
MGNLLLGVFLFLCLALPLGMPALLIFLASDRHPAVTLAFGFFGFFAGLWLLSKITGALVGIEERLAAAVHNSQESARYGEAP